MIRRLVLKHQDPPVSFSSAIIVDATMPTVLHGANDRAQTLTLAQQGFYQTIYLPSIITCVSYSF